MQYILEESEFHARLPRESCLAVLNDFLKACQDSVDKYATETLMHNDRVVLDRNKFQAAIDMAKARITKF